MNLGFALALGCAVVDWYAVARENRILEYVFKPATMLAVILAALLVISSHVESVGASAGILPQLPRPYGFVIGFAFSLAGDVFLFSRSQRAFIFGLVAFLLAHLAYILALNPTPPPDSSLPIYGVCAIIGAGLYAVVANHLRRTPQRRLSIPTAVYAIVISLMLGSAWSTLWRPGWTEARRLFIITGATLFYISDVLLAWNRFVAPFPFARLANMVTYHLGQIVLAVSLAG